MQTTKYILRACCEPATLYAIVRDIQSASACSWVCSFGHHGSQVALPLAQLTGHIFQAGASQLKGKSLTYLPCTRWFLKKGFCCTYLQVRCSTYIFCCDTFHSHFEAFSPSWLHLGSGEVHQFDLYLWSSLIVRNIAPAMSSVLYRHSWASACLTKIAVFTDFHRRKWLLANVLTSTSSYIDAIMMGHEYKIIALDGGVRIGKLGKASDNSLRRRLSGIAEGELLRKNE